MWIEKTFNLTRREVRTTKPFDKVVAAIEAQTPVVVPEANHVLLGQDTVNAIVAGRLDSEALRRQVEGRLGSRVIATPGNSPGSLAAKAATATIPIVFGVPADPVALGEPRPARRQRDWNQFLR